MFNHITLTLPHDSSYYVHFNSNQIHWDYYNYVNDDDFKQTYKNICNEINTHEIINHDPNHYDSYHTYTNK